MKKIISKLYFIIPLMLFGVSSCDINRIPETAISDDTFWKTGEDFKTAANLFYTFIKSYPLDDNWSDDSYGRSSDPISDGSRITPSTDLINYNDPYVLIRACNKLLEQAEAASGSIEESDLNLYRAEARFFRAYAYYGLAIKFGGVPLILKTLQDNSEELYEGKASREEIFSTIFNDLDFAAQHLPLPSNLAEADYGRITKTAVLAFMARAALFEGTRAKYHNYGDAVSYLERAKNASKQVIDSGEHSLLDNYFDMFQYAGEKSKENIIVKVFGVDRDNNVVTHNYFRGNLEQGRINPTKSLVDSYLMTDGLPYDKSPLYKKPENSVEVFNNRDLRLSATVFKQGDPYIASRPIFNIANPAFNTTGFTFRKFSNIEDWQLQRSTMDYPVLRYAEVLLTYAESMFELNGSISDNDLNISINLLRKRAGIPDLSNAFVNANGLDMQTEIRRERRVELAQEGLRYWDLIRWKEAEKVLPKAVYGNYFFADEFGEVNVRLTDDNIILVSEASIRNFDPAKDYLWPLPLNEIALNPALEQNSNW